MLVAVVVVEEVILHLALKVLVVLVVLVAVVAEVLATQLVVRLTLAVEAVEGNGEMKHLPIAPLVAVRVLLFSNILITTQ